MRKKTKQSLDVASVAGAWQAFFDGNKIDDDESLRKAGWLDIYTVAEKVNLSSCTLGRNSDKYGLITKLFRVYRGGKVRQVRYCKPK
jgi:hypothetical protein